MSWDMCVGNRLLTEKGCPTMNKKSFYWDISEIQALTCKHVNWPLATVLVILCCCWASKAAGSVILLMSNQCPHTDHTFPYHSEMKTALCPLNRASIKQPQNTTETITIHKYSSSPVVWEPENPWGVQNASLSSKSRMFESLMNSIEYIRVNGNLIGLLLITKNKNK